MFDTNVIVAVLFNRSLVFRSRKHDAGPCMEIYLEVPRGTNSVSRDAVWNS